MPDFSERMRDRIFERDLWRCVRCGSTEITMQHRRGKGMGGLGYHSPDLVASDGLVLCWGCNADCEANGQADALRCGWKIPRACLTASYEIPYYERRTGNWYLPDAAGGRRWVDPIWAAERVQFALAA